MMYIPVLLLALIAAPSLVEDVLNVSTVSGDLPEDPHEAKIIAKATITHSDSFAIQILAETDKIDLGDSVQLQLSTNLPPAEIELISWFPRKHLSCTECESPWVQPYETTTYDVTVIDKNGFTATASITIYVDRTGGIYIPRAFTPDQDGHNEIFTIYGSLAAKEILTIKIFDRYGKVVFSRENVPLNDPAGGWDGRFEDKALATGVFVYYMEILMIDGTTRIVKGDLSLINESK